jgi:hypothetical protein
MPRIPRSTIYWVRGDDERVNTTYLLDVPVSGVTNGQVVRYKFSPPHAYLPAVAAGLASFSDPRVQFQAVGVIVNISGSTGDLIVSNGKVTGYSGLTPGLTYYLSQSEAGSITATRPEHGVIVTVGTALDANTLLVNIKIEEANPNIRRGQAQSGCSDGQIVRWNGTAYVPVGALNVFQGAVGMITNISGGFGDVYFSGPAPSSSTLVAGDTYYLSTTAGAITNILPINGFRVQVGIALSTSTILLNFNHYYNETEYQLVPINWANKQACTQFWSRTSGTGTLTFDGSNISAMGYGSYAITGTGVWEAIVTTDLSATSVRSHYAVSPTIGMGGFSQFRVNGGTGGLRFGTRFYDRNLTLISGQEWWLFNSSTTATTFTWAQAICRAEGGATGQFPTNARFIRAMFEVTSNPGTIWVDNFVIYPLTFASMALYG